MGTATLERNEIETGTEGDVADVIDAATPGPQQIETGVVSRLIVDKDGRHESEKAAKGLAGKIEVISKCSSDDQDKMVYDYRVLWKDGTGGWKSLADKNQEDLECEKPTDAFNDAFAILSAHFNKLYQDSFASMDYKKIERLNTLRQVVRDAGFSERRVLKSPKYHILENIEGDELTWFLKFTAKHFGNLDSVAPIVFRFRQDFDAEGKTFWKGARKDKDGNAIPVFAKAEKLSPANADLIRTQIGYAPLFAITICKDQWLKADKHRHQGILYSTLYHCQTEGDEKARVVQLTSAQTINLQAELTDLFGPASIPSETGRALAGFIDITRNGEQLDAFGELFPPEQDSQLSQHAEA